MVRPRTKRRYQLPRRDRKDRDKPASKPMRPMRKKICHFCKEKIEYIDFKDVGMLKRYISDRGKIRARRVTGTCVQHQREVATAVKNAREVALLPYVVR